MQKQGKLELTWVGKYEKKKIEPRILVEDKSKSYGDPNSENMLIHGDNLLALKALEQEYAGRIKCIYIDPPYNTGNAFDQYDDNVEHSIWLSLIKDRLNLLYNLLSEDGVIFVQINDDEAAYLKIIMDEVFGRQNYEATIYVKVRHEDRILREDIRYQLVIEQVLMYRKTASFIPPRREKTKDSDDDYEYELSISGVPQEIIKIGGYDVEIYNTDAYKIKKLGKGKGSLKYYQIRGSLITQKGSASEYYEKFLRNRRETDGLGTLYKVIGMGVNGDGLGYRTIFQPTKETSKNGFYLQGRPKREKINKGLPFPNFYDFVQEYNNAGYEGNVDFKGGKKPERYLQFILSLAGLKENDIVLDSFLGSGSTAATCQKLGYHWIGIELGDHAYTHCKVRLDKVIDGEQGGISKAVNWQGGGGYKFYELAPSLLVPNKMIPSIKQINPEYTFEQLCEAICKIEGFKYKPRGNMHGYSSEKRFIHIAQDFVNGEYVNSILSTIDDDESVLIYGTKLQSNLRLPSNVEVKKIPKDLLDKCTFESEVR